MTNAEPSEPLRTPSRWPSLPIAEWGPTRDTLQLWTQIVGKVRLANTPTVNHWWNVPLYVTARGLTSSLIPHRHGLCFQIDFDLWDHRLEIANGAGELRSFQLEGLSVAEFYARIMGQLEELGVATKIWPVPVEIAGAVAFADDGTHATYDPGQAHDFWLLLVQASRVFHLFRSRFAGKSSPVHLFWGALDLAVTRFSGRTAPPHPGGAPNCGPEVMHEAYSHEVCSCGYWPGGEGEGFFYSYAYPEPTGYRSAKVMPETAFFSDTFGEFVLPYEVVRAAVDPDAVLLEFLQSSYEVAADCAEWDREALERQPRGPMSPSSPDA
ncbi:MAG: DUF5996 family protein [Acidimicrobiales bacterium]|jgi:hypothetical protein